ncbi:MAG TPA: DoxX family protein [Planctomycetota bacterium]|nr:DoxX family protein [Planctomycetota bacterium]
MIKYLYKDVDARVSTGLLLLRLVAGVAFMLHGWGKIQNPMGWMGPNASVPGIFQALAAISEFGGGLAWVLGLLTPLACLGLLATMAVAAFTHISKGDPFVGGYELATVYFAIAFLLLMAGPGRFSLDSILFGSRNTAAADGQTRLAVN